MEITRAQGQETIRNHNALYTQLLKVAPSITRDGTIAFSARDIRLSKNIS